MKTIKLLVNTLALILVTVGSSALADVRLPAMFTDHAVLQRDMPVPVWGWAEPGEEVTVAIAGQKHNTTADTKGKWRVTLKPLSIGEPLTLVVEGKNRVAVEDILVGEVWICSGQSNMEWSVAQSSNPDLEIATAKHPRIRLITVGCKGSQTQMEDFEGRWAVCSPESAKDFSAVGYFFGRELENHLEVPIGLVDNAWGGSACDAWIRRDRMEGNPLYQPQLDKWDKKAREVDEARTSGGFDDNSAEWQNKVAELDAQHRPANLFHGRLGPIMPYAIRGVIWYQGESNASRAFQYRDMFPLMISSWREAWDQGDFPFYWVQLADFKAEKPEPGGSDWAELREAQTLAQDRLPNTGEAVIIDLGEGSDIHPRNKLEVARRLARWALAEDYGREIVARSPRFDALEKQEGKLIVKFKDINGGLRTIDDNRVKGFAIAGPDRKWVWADARLLDNGRVEVSSENVSDPVAVRYAWADNPICNLYNMSGLPVTPFRSDDWPGVTDNER